MKFKYAQMRVRQLKGSLQPTESSVVIDWPIANEKGKAAETLPFSKELEIKQIRSARN